MAVQEPAVGVFRMTVELFRGFLLKLFLGLRRLFLGFFQRLLLGPGLETQSFGPRLGALLLAFLFAGVAFAADRLQVRLEVIGAVVVVDLFAGLDLFDGADKD